MRSRIFGGASKKWVKQLKLEIWGRAQRKAARGVR